MSGKRLVQTGAAYAASNQLVAHCFGRWFWSVDWLHGASAQYIITDCVCGLFFSRIAFCVA